MKPVEELGISPTPWSVEVDPEYGDIEVSDRNDHTIAQIFSWEPKTDARIIVAVPKLYEKLYEAIVNYCENCEIDGHGATHPCTFLDKCFGCKCNDECVAKSWRAALAEASGELKGDA